jgi:hypothetical protein
MPTIKAPSVKRALAMLDVVCIVGSGPGGTATNTVAVLCFVCVR